MKVTAYLLVLFLCFGCRYNDDDATVDVLIAGGGTSGTMAGIQAAKLGSSVLIVEETPWLGGMLTSAGVSATDGNYELYSGLWEEFRQRIYRYYGGQDRVKTGWVSNVMFEPQVAAAILDSMATSRPGLHVETGSVVSSIHYSNNLWHIVIRSSKGSTTVHAKIVVDATELGDVSKMAGISYDVGMDSRSATGERLAPEHPNNIVQDLTYTAILKYYKDTTHLLAKPTSYDPAAFFCTCAGKCDQDTIAQKLWDCNTMIKYGKLPNKHYMINWPIFGNDYYVNAINLPPDDRAEAFRRAKEHTLCYIYYLQQELGFKHLGIADDVFPTSDGLPFIPYHRESRRVHGMVRFDLNDLARPYDQEDNLYKTGIAVGDYPVDQHHAAYHGEVDLPDLHFQPVPSYTVPLGTLIPKSADQFIVAEKSISVTNLVNGTTRLQPVCMLIGQAAGVLAHLAVEEGVTPARVPVRQVQDSLLAAGAYILPFADVLPRDPAFAAVQRIGATGMLRGAGQHRGWKNYTFFYPDSLLTTRMLSEGLQELGLGEIKGQKKALISMNYAFEALAEMARNNHLTVGEKALSSYWNTDAREQLWHQYQLGDYHNAKNITRKQFAVLLDTTLDPFHWDVDQHGMLQK